jgi:hypothetical protein
MDPGVECMDILGRRLFEALASSSIDTAKLKDLQGQLTSLISETSRMHGDKFWLMRKS